VEQLTTLFNAIVDSAKQIGSSSVAVGKPYGLRGYPDYHRELYPGSFRQAAWEEPLTEGLAGELRRRGYLASTEKFYPCGGRCDLIVELPETDEIWIECKTAFRQHLGPATANSLYKYDYDGHNAFDPGRGRDSWVAGVGDIGLKDIPKLLTLTANDAAYVGVLLLGFDRVQSPFANQDLYELLPPELNEWLALHGAKEGIGWPDCYPVRAEQGFRERLWFWCRRVESKSKITSEATPSITPTTVEEVNDRRNRAMAAVRRFCSVPYRSHGNRQTSGPYRGWYKHDWGHLVQSISLIYLGRELPIPTARSVGDRVRSIFKNAANWDRAVNLPGAHDEILTTILDGIR